MIKNIKFMLEGYTDKHVDIELNGKNLILTGANGCGKTRFLNQFYALLVKYFNRNVQPEKQLLSNISHYRNLLKETNTSHPNYNSYKQNLDSYENMLELQKKNFIHFDNEEEVFELVNKKQIILQFFKADRLANNIANDGKIGNLTFIRKQGKDASITNEIKGHFESYLVAYYNYASHVIARENRPIKAEKINEWFSNVEKDLQNLFEDNTLKLEYNAEENAFYIHQEGKLPFRFNQLSSGYTAILSIYAELLMKVELKEIPAKELAGFVFIDEIDVHLHVSLQRKIFSFFSETFPNIQFIITTHSPFVLQSVDDAIIYDLSSGECLEDLSMYSYQAILKGLLDVDTSSDILNAKIDDLAKLIQETSTDLVRLATLIKEIEPHEDKLDVRSKAFLALAKNKLIDCEEA